MKASLQKQTVENIVQQKKKSDKVEFDSSLMTVEEFADCYQAALQKLQEPDPEIEDAD